MIYRWYLAMLSAALSWWFATVVENGLDLPITDSWLLIRVDVHLL